MRSSVHTSLWLLVLCVAAPALAQQGGPNTLEFSFSNPGARALGLGGAFIGLADDATAAYTNPAGLVQLTRPEVSAELRHWRYHTQFTEGGRASGTPTGFGIDTSSGLRPAWSDAALTDLSFLSFVYPMEDWSLSFHRHQLARFESDVATQGLFSEVIGSPELSSRLADIRTRTELDFVGYSGAASYRVSDRLSLGAGLSWIETRMLIESDQYSIDADTFEAFFAPNSYLPERLMESLTMEGRGGDWTLAAGFRLRLAERLWLGGVYRQGPGVDVGIEGLAGPLYDPAVPPGSSLGSVGTRFELPDVYGLGLAWRNHDQALTLSFDWQHVEYSTITASLDPQLFDQRPVIDDADELRFGAEYVLLDSAPLLALRFGFWHDPDHRFRARDDERDIYARAFFQPGDDQLHVAFGVGVAFSGFQLDFGADFADTVDTLSFSGIWAF